MRMISAFLSFVFAVAALSAAFELQFWSAFIGGMLSAMFLARALIHE